MAKQRNDAGRNLIKYKSGLFRRVRMVMMPLGRTIVMSDHTAQQALAMPMIEARGTIAKEPVPREFLTLSLVATCLAFWTVVILAVAHLG